MSRLLQNMTQGTTMGTLRFISSVGESYVEHTHTRGKASPMVQHILLIAWLLFLDFSLKDFNKAPINKRPSK